MNDLITAFRNYLEFEKKYSSHTCDAYFHDALVFESFLNKEFPEVELVSLEYFHIRNWIVFLVENDVDNASVNRKMASLKSFFKFLLKAKVIEYNPMLKHRSLKVDKKVQIPFSQTEMGLIKSNYLLSDTFKDVRNMLIVELFYTTGIRRSELIGLKLSNVDIDNKVIKVLGKGNKERYIPVVPQVVELIMSYLFKRIDLQVINDDLYFFLSEKGNKLSESFVYRLINDYFSNVSEKVKKSPHVLRHTFATHLLDNGADLNSVKELLGHSSLASTQVYTNSSLVELKKTYSQAHPRELK